MTIALITADTHIPGFRRELPQSLAPYLARCDVILHAGDVTDPGVLDRLQAFAPVIAVAGNMDGPDLAAWGAAAVIVTDVGGVTVAMLHDAGPARGRDRRLLGRFPGAGLIVFGHSHIPCIARAGATTIVNPGSPTWKRRQPHPTIAIARLGATGVDARLVELPGD